MRYQHLELLGLLFIFEALRVEKRRREEEKLVDARRINIIVAMVSVLVAGLNYFYQYTHPISAIQLLTEMQKQSSPISTIGHNGKPTVVDFWAPWCENCKAEAPTLFQIESEYRDRVNFVMINGDEVSSWDLVERFRVDAIPHLALVSSEGDVETALIGIIPAKVLRSDLDIMVLNAMMQSDGNIDPKDKAKFQLPFVGFDAFKSHPEDRRLEF